VTESKPSRRRVERDESEVTSWPRGLVSYVPDRAPEERPSPDEDRTANRLALAARLIGLLRAQGADVEREIDELRAAERAFTAHDRRGATARVDRLLGKLEPRAGPAAESSTHPSP
jgi:hypothetical protein